MSLGLPVGGGATIPPRGWPPAASAPRTGGSWHRSGNRTPALLIPSRGALGKRPFQSLGLAPCNVDADLQARASVRTAGPGQPSALPDARRAGPWWGSWVRKSRSTPSRGPGQWGETEGSDHLTLFVVPAGSQGASPGPGGGDVEAVTHRTGASSTGRLITSLAPLPSLFPPQTPLRDEHKI